MSTLFDIPLHRLEGQDATLGDYRGKVMLIVNVASQCGLTPQYAGLEKLFEQYEERGLVVLGFPCNDFGAQEPGTEAEIADFCQRNYGVRFPMFEKVEVNRDARHPLYKELIAAQPQARQAGSRSAVPKQRECAEPDGDGEQPGVQPVNSRNDAGTGSSIAQTIQPFGQRLPAVGGLILADFHSGDCLAAATSLSLSMPSFTP